MVGYSPKVVTVKKPYLMDKRLETQPQKDQTQDTRDKRHRNETRLDGSLETKEASTTRGPTQQREKRDERRNEDKVGFFLFCRSFGKSLPEACG